MSNVKSCYSYGTKVVKLNGREYHVLLYTHCTVNNFLYLITCNGTVYFSLYNEGPYFFVCNHVSTKKIAKKLTCLEFGTFLYFACNIFNLCF